jgi:hypothetical protein
LIFLYVHDEGYYVHYEDYCVHDEGYYVHDVITFIRYAQSRKVGNQIILKVWEQVNQRVWRGSPKSVKVIIRYVITFILYVITFIMYVITFIRYVITFIRYVITFIMYVSNLVCTTRFCNNLHQVKVKSLGRLLRTWWRLLCTWWRLIRTWWRLLRTWCDIYVFILELNLISTFLF